MSFSLIADKTEVIYDGTVNFTLVSDDTDVEEYLNENIVYIFYQSRLNDEPVQYMILHSPMFYINFDEDIFAVEDGDTNEIFVSGDDWETDKITITIIHQSDEGEVDILSLCEQGTRDNVERISVNCRHFHQDMDMTPNNYDLYLDYNNIPVNIRLESKHDLLKELKRHLPLTKRLHLQLEEDNVALTDTFDLYTRTRIIFTNQDNETIMRDVK